MELEKESRIKNGRELKEAMQTRAKKKRREQEKWEEGIRGIKGKNKMDSLREKTTIQPLGRRGRGRILVVSR